MNEIQWVSICKELALVLYLPSENVESYPILENTCSFLLRNMKDILNIRHFLWFFWCVELFWGCRHIIFENTTWFSLFFDSTALSFSFFFSFYFLFFFPFESCGTGWVDACFFPESSCIFLDSLESASITISGLLRPFILTSSKVSAN